MGLRLAAACSVWQTVGMTNQQSNQQPRPQHREDYKVQALIARIEKKIALQAKAARKANQASAN
jgi:hypothetical protein